jgi:hypothetical protein
MPLGACRWCKPGSSGRGERWSAGNRYEWVAWWFGSWAPMLMRTGIIPA